MPEDIGFIETGGGSEGGSEVSEAAMARVREDAKAASGMRAQIVKSGKKNKQYAKLLSLLLMYVNDERLLQVIFAQMVDEKLPIEIIVGEYLPYLHQRVDISPLQPLYVKIWDNATTPRMSRKELEDYYADVWKLFGLEWEKSRTEKLVKMMVRELRIPVEEPISDK